MQIIMMMMLFYNMRKILQKKLNVKYTSEEIFGNAEYLLFFKINIDNLWKNVVKYDIVFL